MHSLSLVYLINIPLLVSEISRAHHQEVSFMYVASSTSKLTASKPGWNSVPPRAVDTPETCRSILIQ
jgi:hypothetical protein